MKLRISSLLAVLGTLSLPIASANHVDFIVDGGFMISRMDGCPVSATQLGDPGNIIGSEREVRLLSDLGTTTAELAVPAGPGPVGPGASFIGVSGDTPDSLSMLELLYNGVGSVGLNNGAGADFLTNWNAFGINMLSVTGGLLDLRVTAGDINGNFGEVAIPDLGAAGDYFVLFNDPGFTNAGVDFSILDSVNFSFETTIPGTEYSIGGITRETVPEPGAGLLTIVGAWGLILIRRRA